MTQYIQNDKYCNYLDYNLYPANKMLQKCIGDQDPQQACRYQMKTQMFNNSINDTSKLFSLCQFTYDIKNARKYSRCSICSIISL